MVLQPVKTDLDSLCGILEKVKPNFDIEEQRRVSRNWVGDKKGRS